MLVVTLSKNPVIPEPTAPPNIGFRAFEAAVPPIAPVAPLLATPPSVGLESLWR